MASKALCTQQIETVSRQVVHGGWGAHSHFKNIIQQDVSLEWWWLCWLCFPIFNSLFSSSILYPHTPSLPISHVTMMQEFIAFSHMTHTELRQAKHSLIIVDIQWRWSTDQWISHLFRNRDISITSQRKKLEDAWANWKFWAYASNIQHPADFFTHWKQWCPSQSSTLVMFTYITNPSPYTAARMKVYISIDRYMYFHSGWVNNAAVWTVTSSESYDLW